MKTLIALFAMSFVLGCNSESTADSKGSVDNNGSSEVSNLEYDSFTMEEVSIPDGFNLNTVNTYTLDIALEQLSDSRTFVSLYTDFDEQQNTIDYSSKILTIELDLGEASVSFPLNEFELPIMAEAFSIDSNLKLRQKLNFVGEKDKWLN